ncbi:RNA-dependent RNA polymerase family protein, partial [Acinetobacter baumannii]|uniref:hypothetical protein n=1 Tax=Acinetobacter baumannii TaxID=470 RepID=UPI00196B4B0F
RIVRAYVNEQLEKGFIRRSTSAAAAPVMLAYKPGGGVRFYVDYRGLNEATIKNRFPLPLVYDTLAQIRKAKFFTKINVIAAFNRLRIAKGHK